MDGDGKPMVNKGEATRGATLDERRSTGAARGRGGAQAASTWKHRGERVQRCSSLSGRKGEKGVGRSGTVCARARGGGRPTMHGDDGAGGGRVSRGGALGGSSTVACGPRLESMGQPGEKRNGPRPRKQFRAAVVN
jgi:hypothetical protein